MSVKSLSLSWLSLCLSLSLVGHTDISGQQEQLDNYWLGFSDLGNTKSLRKRFEKHYFMLMFASSNNEDIHKFILISFLIFSLGMNNKTFMF